MRVDDIDGQNQFLPVYSPSPESATRKPSSNSPTASMFAHSALVRGSPPNLNP